jgi:hypothetical protein
MCTSPPVPVHLFPRAGGVDVVPHVLPIHIRDDDRDMTVAEYFGLDEKTVRDTP